MKISALESGKVAQHLNELGGQGFHHDKNEGLDLNYSLFPTDIARFIDIFEAFFERTPAVLMN